MGLILHFHLFFVTALQTAWVFLVTYQTNLLEQELELIPAGDTSFPDDTW